MEIATGYFAKAKAYADMGYALVSIAKVAPWFLPKVLTLDSLPELAPTDAILALKDAPEEYSRRYASEILSNLRPSDVYSALHKIASVHRRDKVVLLCYESPEKFCHRHLVADWLNDNLGIKVEEVALTKKSGQQDMFCEESGT